MHPTTDNTAVLSEKVRQLEARCDKKDRAIDLIEQDLKQVFAFQNRMIGYALAASAFATLATHIILAILPHPNP